MCTLAKNIGKPFPSGRVFIYTKANKLLYNETMNFIRLDKQSKIPLYQQLVESFARAIESRVLLPDDRLPSEEVLCHTFGISRSVVKLAYDDLETKGLIHRTPKGGTFVSRNNRYQAILNQVPFFLEALKKSAFDWAHTINLNEIIDHQRHMKITYFIDGIPMIVSDVYIPEDLVFDVSEDWSILKDNVLHTTQFKSVLLTKVEAQFFQRSESMAVYDFLTNFKKEGVVIAVLHQWVSPHMGQLQIEVTDGH